MEVYSIYTATNTVNNKIYVGFTGNFETRLTSHKKGVRLGQDKALYHAIRKYGWDSFVWVVVYQSWDKNHTKCVMEPYFIQALNSHIDHGHGYNMTAGGDGANDISQKSRNAMGWSRGIKLGNYTEDRCKSISEGKKSQGLKMSADQKELIRQKLTGKKMPESCLRKKSKDYECISPEGEIFTIYNLNRFCKENGLNQGAMSQVSLGKAEHYKGWKVRVL